MESKHQKVYTDERTLQLERKLGNELAYFAIILLLISIFVKIVIWHLSVESYLPEIFIILGMEIYAGIRSWQLGLDIRRYNPTNGVKTFRSRLANGFVVAMVIVLIQLFNSSTSVRVYFKQYPILQFLLIFVAIFLLTSLFDMLVNYFYKKKQEEFEQELDELEEK